ncbi:glycosyl transferase [Nocardioides gansuensis]|uniref:Glycosyl transferase n=1 Tax=Nocardioides gansuensis TaxID=2138300 RepID=A0A2T8F6Z2_9ACTN|nr:glycosyl transferase [Nocardioides gansuensis]
MHLLVPYWGEPALLDATVESVLAQTDPHWSLTIVDDCYPDHTAGERYGAHPDPRIRYLRNERNLGTAGNFERCRQLVEHELAAFPGCDDLLLPDYVARVRELHLRFPSAAFFQPGVRVVGGDGEEVRGLTERVKAWLAPDGPFPRMVAGEALATSLLHGNWLYWPSLAFRADVIRDRPFRPDLPIILDLALILDLVLSGEQLVVDDHACFAYRRHDASASATARFDGHRFSDEDRFHHEVEQRLDALGWRRARRAARLHATSRLHALTLLPGVLRSGSREQVRELLRHAVR